jgi:hypothetical protein
MPQNSGTLVAAPIRPNASEDTYPVAYQSEIKGGWHSVQDLTALAAIPALRLEQGMIAWVIDEDAPYQWDGAAWGIFSIGTGDVVGPGSATDAHIPQFDGTTGKLLKDGLALDTDGTLAANSDTRLASQKAIKTYVDAEASARASADAGKQPLDATLTALAGLATGSNKIPYSTGTDTFGQLDAPTGAIVGTTDTQTLTNKRRTLRTVTLADAATVTPNSDTTDVGILATLSQTTTFNNPTGTPTSAQLLEIQVYDASARSVSFDTQYRATDAALPTTTTAGKTSRWLFQWHATDSKWDLLAKTTVA